MKDLQQFLQTTKFEKGCEIHSKVQNSEGKKMHIFMTFIDDEHGFEIEIFSTGSLPIIADQKYDGKEKRILNLSVMELLTHFKPLNDAYPWRVPFNVTMKTQPIEPIFSDYLEDVDEDYVLENIKENDWIKINIIPQNIVNVRYSNKINEFATAQERVTFINATLGCQMSIIKAEKLTDTIQNHENGRIPVPDSLRGNNRKRRPPSYLEDESD
uniref:Uncharacterized protein n=1 Tax=Panagrolaimus sp. JU765 TaxID=591449 RepID=A0AC34QCJ7_9BILA